MRVPEQTIRDIKDRVSIREVVEDYVRLVKDGANYKGLCPFHQEKTPSFKVHEGKGIFKCFGCGESGNVFTFLMKVEGMSFPEALEKLASRAGVSLPRREETPKEKEQRKKKEELFEANLAAARFYRRNLKELPEAVRAREHLESRGIGTETVDRYMLGYSPEDWSATLEALKAKGISEAAMHAAGLVIARDNGGYYDRFRGRLMFPIADVQGRIRGFGARTIKEEEGQPKYINTPETQVFKKGRGLFGIHKAKDAIRKEGRAIIVEGYTDQIALDMAGIGCSVATLGTALTEEHAYLIRRYAPEVYLLFDADEAGKKAGIRALEVFLDAGVSPRIVLMPEGMDPDDFLRQKGVESFLALLNDSPPLLSHYMDSLMAEAEDDPAGVAKAVSTAAQMIARISDPVERSVFTERLSRKSGVPFSRIESSIRRPSRKEGLPQMEPAQEPDIRAQEIDLVRLLVHHPETAAAIRDSGAAHKLQNKEISSLVNAMLDQQENLGTMDLGALISDIEDPLIKNRVSGLVFEKDPFRGIVERVLADVTKRLVEGDIEDRLRSLRRRITEAQDRGEEGLWRSLIEEQQALLQRQKQMLAGETG